MSTRPDDGGELITGHPTLLHGDANTPTAPRLFGRLPLVSQLHDIFYRTVATTREDPGTSSGTSQLVILHGPSGVGKKSLIRTLQPLVRAHHGLLVATSASIPNECAHIKGARTRPVRPVFLEAVTNLFHATTEGTWNALVASSFLAQHFNPSDLELLIEILEPFHKIQESNASLPPESISGNDNATHRPTFYMQLSSRIGSNTNSILARFMGAASTLFPLVLLLEDAHQADTESLDALANLLDSTLDASAGKGLLVALSCRDDAPSDAMNTFLSDFATRAESDDVSNAVDWIHTLTVTNLSRDSVRDWIQDASSREDLVAEMTDVVYKCTRGNPQLVRYIMVLLKLNKVASSAALKSLGASKGPLSGNAMSLFQQILEQQDALVQRIVEKVICLRECDGRDDITIPLLETVFQKSCSSALAVAQECGLLESQHGRFKLASHDLQQAAYAQIPEAKRAKIHLLLGRRLWKNSALRAQDDVSDADATLLHVIAEHLRRGMDLVTDAEERKVIVTIHWKAGKKAMQVAAFPHAVTHFEEAISVMGDLPWNSEEYDTILTLHNCAAEAYYCVGDFFNMHRVLDAVFDNAASFQDKLQAYTTLVFANGARHRFQDAIAVAFDVLDKLDEPIPRNPGKMLIVVEYVKTQRRLKGKNDRYFSNLPSATDPSKIAAMTMLNFTSTHLLVEKPEFAALAIFRLIRLVLDYGTTSSAPIAFCGYGMTMLFSERIQEGYRYGQIALSILDMVESKAWLPRTYMMFYGRINPWVKPFRDSVEPLRLAQRAALRSGDIEGSVHTAANVYLVTLYSGATLSVVEPEIRAFYTLMESLGQTAGLVFLLLQRDFFSDLVGKSRGNRDSTGNLLANVSAFNLAEQEGNKMFVMYIHFYRMIRQAHAGEYSEAIASARNIRSFFKGSHFLVDFYEGFAALAHARDSVTRCSGPRRTNSAIGRRNVKRMTRYAVICPANFRNKRALLEAELEALRGRSNRAIALYNESIIAAKEEGFTPEEGLACERLALYHCFLGEVHLAEPFFAFARDAYSRWGANMLVERTDELVRQSMNQSKPELSSKSA